MYLLMVVRQYHGNQSSKQWKHVDHPLSEVMLLSYMKIELHALHRLKNDALKGDRIKHILPKSFTFINPIKVMKFFFKE